jgi:hydroxymethylbilane synthase
VGIRGNVDTRLRKLEDGEYDALVLALAGLRRLGRTEACGAVLDLVPAAGQGTLVLEARADDARARGCALRIADTETMVCLTAERALVRTLQADCHTPVGAHASRDPAGGRLTLRAFVGREDGSMWLRDELTEHPPSNPERLGETVAQRLLAAGAAEVLGR